MVFPTDLCDSYCQELEAENANLLSRLAHCHCSQVNYFSYFFSFFRVMFVLSSWPLSIVIAFSQESLTDVRKTEGVKKGFVCIFHSINICNCDAGRSNITWSRL